MPLYLDQVIEELEAKKGQLTESIIKQEVIEEFQAAITGLKEEFGYHELKDKLSEQNYPGAVPTIEYEQNHKLVIPFAVSDNWSSHEAVNNWSREQLEDCPIIAADGSQINPITEFEQVVALVQVVWLVNHHTADGNYQEDVETIILTPDDLLVENYSTGQLQINEQEVHLSRFELVNCSIVLQVVSRLNCRLISLLRLIYQC
ncbi:hypothetical protein MWH25_08700 [Natroniella acetigena]|uniref:hypothetical protein n=1 Tax=Natroniella acetigena TaxID=52004 RepID=UPI00200B24CD|nr:hypothetical protein [Natroniella acetigena]MCK8827818.1 hypothetical protein [Natroniella acetigena]